MLETAELQTPGMMELPWAMRGGITQVSGPIPFQDLLTVWTITQPYMTHKWLWREWLTQSAIRVYVHLGAVVPN
jgi:hypothetical protein